MKIDPMAIIKANWVRANLKPPFSVTSPDIVKDATGAPIASGLGNPARADVVAGALNYAITKQDELVVSLCAHLLLTLDYVPDPRLDLQGLFKGVPKMLTVAEASDIVWKYMNERHWDELVEESKDADALLD